jgi:hypothetical protein
MVCVDNGRCEPDFEACFQEQRSKREIEAINLATAVETTDEHRFTQMEKEMGGSTGLERFRLLGDL